MKKTMNQITKKSINKIFLLFLLLSLILPIKAFAQTDKLNIYLFYGESCPHCKELEEFLEPYLKENENVILNKYEVWNNKDNQEKLNEVQKILNDNSSGVPYLIIGNNIITGYDSEITPERIKNTINYYQNIE